jgi:hypothetical protein
MAENNLDIKQAERIQKITKEIEELTGKKINGNLRNASQALKDYGKKTEEIESTGRKINKNLKMQNELLQTANSTVGNSVNILADITKIGSIFALGSIAKKMLELNSELHRAVINAGKGVEALAAYKNMASNLSIEMGATQEQAEKLVKVLAERQYAGTTKDIGEAARASYGLARAFGLNVEEVANNTVELQKWGQVSAKTTTAMYADIMKVAQANGLTKEGVKSIMDTTVKWSGMLKAFGKGPQDVQRFNMSLSKAVSALEKVGIKAQDVVAKIEQLMDPENLEDNIPAYAALGISITDAITGNIDPERMASGLKEFGQKLKQMGPIAGAAYAKAMGVSYKDAIKAASADMEEASKVKMTPEEESLETLKSLTQNTKDFTEKIQDTVLSIGGRIRKFGPIALLLFTALINIAAKLFTKKMSEGISETIKKSKKEASEAIKDTTNEMGEKFSEVEFSPEMEAINIDKGLKESYDKLKEFGKYASKDIENALKSIVEDDDIVNKKYVSISELKDKEIKAMEEIAKFKKEKEEYSITHSQEAYERKLAYLSEELFNYRKNLIQENKEYNIAMESRKAKIKELETLQKQAAENKGFLNGLRKAANAVNNFPQIINEKKNKFALKAITSLETKLTTDVITGRWGIFTSLGMKAVDKVRRYEEKLRSKPITRTIKEIFVGGKKKVNKKTGEEKTTKGLIGGLGSLMKGLGIASLAMAGLSLLLKPIMENLQGEIAPLMENLQKTFGDSFKEVSQKLIPIIKTVFGTLATVGKEIGKILSGVIQRLLEKLTPIIQKICNIIVELMPLIEWAIKILEKPLNLLISVLNLLISGVEAIVGWFYRGKKVLEDNTGSVSDNTDALEKSAEKDDEIKPDQIKAIGKKIVYLPAKNSSDGQRAQENKAKEQQEVEREKKQEKRAQEQKEATEAQTKAISELGETIRMAITQALAEYSISGSNALMVNTPNDGKKANNPWDQY